MEGELDTTHAPDAHTDPARWYTIPRARLMPTTFIVKARKPGEFDRSASQADRDKVDPRS